MVVFKQRSAKPLFREHLGVHGDVAKWFKAEVCKTSIRRFESARRLHIANERRSPREIWGFFAFYVGFDMAISVAKTILVFYS